MRRVFHYFLLLILLGQLFTSCKETEEPNQGVEILGVPEAVQVLTSDELFTLDIEVKGMDGLANFSIFIDGVIVVGHFINGNSNTSLSTPFTFQTHPMDVGKVIKIDFTGRDVDGDTQTATLTLKIENGVGENIVLINSDIESDQTWTADKSYLLDGRILVKNGATLNIEEGTVIKATRGNDAENQTQLIITRGSKINAIGTASNPIIFTSMYANNESSTNFDLPRWSAGTLGQGYFDSDYQTIYPWGGIHILGKAKGSFEGDGLELALPGIPNGSSNVRYGGNDNEDNSGTLDYVSIRFAGFRNYEGGEDKDIFPALTLGAVGSGTIIQHLEIYFSNAKALQILGGSVKVSDLIIYQGSSFGLSIDQGWYGGLDNFIIAKTRIAIQSLGPKGSYFEKNHELTNGSVFGDLEGGLYNLFDDSNSGFSNLAFYAEYVATGISIFPKKFNPIIQNNQILIGNGYYSSPIPLLPEGYEKYVEKITTKDQFKVGASEGTFAPWSWVYSFRADFDNYNYGPGF